ncbi:hypothetical protein [Shewanella sp. Iso12]|uniref:hypothetical protein n=1 Tax=Shewanella sp. Iso12 TaxID=1826753 RepID=UPI0014312806|nr:hypothetical protein [Shewanella sp. Iso12]NJI86923.1 hypothetical protein [Shewanella sp. Iso12]
MENTHFDLDQVLKARSLLSKITSPENESKDLTGSVLAEYSLGKYNESIVIINSGCKENQEWFLNSYQRSVSYCEKLISAFKKSDEISIKLRKLRLDRNLKLSPNDKDEKVSVLLREKIVNLEVIRTLRLELKKLKSERSEMRHKKPH